MRIIYKNEKITQESKDTYFGMLTKHVYKIDMIEFPPHKRIIKFAWEGVRGMPTTSSVYIPLPYVQFIKKNQLGHISVYVATTTKPYEPGDQLHELPLPNSYNLAICFGGQFHPDEKSVENCADFFWKSTFGKDYQFNMISFTKLNELTSNPKLINISKTYLKSLKKWTAADPLKLNYIPNDKLAYLRKG